MKRDPGFVRLLTLLLITATLWACDRQRVFEENRALEKGTWRADQRVVFETAITDTTLRYNVYLNVRNAMDYPYSNLYLFLDTRFPDGRIARDTIDCLLADYDGRWLGSGMGSLKYSRFLFQQGVRFPQSGGYRFELQHAMRTQTLQGIHDIGLRIEKEAGE